MRFMPLHTVGQRQLTDAEIRKRTLRVVVPEDTEEAPAKRVPDKVLAPGFRVRVAIDTVAAYRSFRARDDGLQTTTIERIDLPVVEVFEDVGEIDALVGRYEDLLARLEDV